MVIPLSLKIDGVQCGMIQAKFNSYNDFSSSIQKSDTQTNVSGVLMGYGLATSASRTYSDPIYGGSYNWNDHDTTFGYWGYMHMVVGRTYVFGKQFDDSVYIKIDGVVVLKNTINTQFATGTYVPKTTGWHELEVRVSDVFGEKGANGHLFDGSFRRWGSTMGVGWRDDGIQTAVPKSGWRKLMDDGTGRLLCSSKTIPCRISLLFPDSYSKIESATILGALQAEIPSDAFAGCTSLRSIYRR